MSATMPTRIDGDLFEAAKAVGDALGRSAAQQISHWARIGREVEASSAVSQRDIQRVLSGQTEYDDLAPVEQATVRADWDEQIEARIGSLDLAQEFTAAARPWTDADADGNPVNHGS
jgi:hypothetical protein